MRLALVLALPLVVAGCAMPSEGARSYDGLDDGGALEAAVATEPPLGALERVVATGPALDVPRWSRAPIEVERGPSLTVVAKELTSVQSAVLASPSTPSDPFRVAAPASLCFERAVAGRYAMLLRDGYSGGCSRSRTRSDSMSALALVLERDGRATACRARQSQSTTTSMELVPTQQGEGLSRRSSYVRTERERRGYRGEWSRESDVISVVLRRDDSVCAPLAEGGATPPETWRMRCAAVRARAEDVALPGTGLACTVSAAPWGESHGYTVRSLDNATALWMLLGPDRGWQIRAEGMRLGGFTSVEVTRAASRIDAARSVDLSAPLYPF